MTRRLLDTFADRMQTAARQQTVSANLGKLTPREREVLIEVGAGLSNSEITGRLTPAETTVKPTSAGS